MKKKNYLAIFLFFLINLKADSCSVEEAKYYYQNREDFRYEIEKKKFFEEFMPIDLDIKKYINISEEEKRYLSVKGRYKNGKLGYLEKGTLCPDGAFAPFFSIKYWNENGKLLSEIYSANKKAGLINFENGKPHFKYINGIMFIEYDKEGNKIFSDINGERKHYSIEGNKENKRDFIIEKNGKFFANENSEYFLEIKYNPNERSNYTTLDDIDFNILFFNRFKEYLGKYSFLKKVTKKNQKLNSDIYYESIHFYQIEFHNTFNETMDNNGRVYSTGDFFDKPILGSDELNKKIFLKKEKIENKNKNININIEEYYIIDEYGNQKNKKKLFVEVFDEFEKKEGKISRKVMFIGSKKPMYEFTFYPKKLGNIDLNNFYLDSFFYGLRYYDNEWL